MRAMYEHLKALAKANRVSVKDLLALHRTNDPFYYGSPADRQAAEWFAALWERFGFTTGVHLRRVHYRLVSQTDPAQRLRPDGTVYENTEAC